MAIIDLTITKPALKRTEIVRGDPDEATDEADEEGETVESEDEVDREAGEESDDDPFASVFLLVALAVALAGALAARKFLSGGEDVEDFSSPHDADREAESSA